jgi:hypothetical protein
MKKIYAEKDLVLKEFQTLPSVGKAGALDLWNMGFRSIEELKGKNPMELYEKLCHITGLRHDICVLYSFRCMVYFVTEKDHENEKLKWWYWKDKRYNE